MINTTLPEKIAEASRLSEEKQGKHYHHEQAVLREADRALDKDLTQAASLYVDAAHCFMDGEICSARANMVAAKGLLNEENNMGNNEKQPRERIVRAFRAGMRGQFTRLRMDKIKDSGSGDTHLAPAYLTLYLSTGGFIDVNSKNIIMWVEPDDDQGNCATFTLIPTDVQWHDNGVHSFRICALWDIGDDIFSLEAMAVIEWDDQTTHATLSIEMSNCSAEWSYERVEYEGKETTP